MCVHSYMNELTCVCVCVYVNVLDFSLSNSLSVLHKQSRCPFATTSLPPLLPPFIHFQYATGVRRFLSRTFRSQLIQSITFTNISSDFHPNIAHCHSNEEEGRGLRLRYSARQWMHCGCSVSPSRTTTTLQRSWLKPTSRLLRFLFDSLNTVC